MVPRRKKIAILGSTGSIGGNAIKIVSHLDDRIEVFGVAAGGNVERLSAQCAELNCSMAVVGDESRFDELRRLAPATCRVAAGTEGMIELAISPEVDVVLCAVVGTAGLLPVLAAARAGKTIALASKEVLVMAGELVMKEAEANGATILPVDSEHSAIFQCLGGRAPESLSRLLLTASGGPFRGFDRQRLLEVDWRAAMAHPTWAMGPKVTIDSATLMNKALEIVEARWLFDVPGDNISVVIHPQSIIHSMVEFVDGTVLAQMSAPDMRFPIQYALTHPEKLAGALPPLNFARLAGLTFEEPDRKNFPSLDFAHEALNAGDTMPAVMNAANEVAVELFRRGETTIPGIWNIIEKTMSCHNTLESPALEDIIHIDAWARGKAAEMAEKM